MDEMIAWGVVVAAALGALAGVVVLTGRVGNRTLRWLLRSLFAVWLLLPWSIEVVPGHYAPAFLVAVFEGVFRTDGNPRPPLVALGLATAVVVMGFAVLTLVLWLRRPRPPAP